MSALFKEHPGVDFHLNHVGYKGSRARYAVSVSPYFHLNHVGYKDVADALSVVFAEPFI